VSTVGPLNPELKVSEELFQKQLVRAARLLGWNHMHARRSKGRNNKWTTATNVTGWPDLFLWHETQQRAIAAELKTDIGRVSHEQRAVLDSLAHAGIETYVWRPRDWDQVLATLKAVPA
jgi:hypothetical protein